MAQDHEILQLLLRSGAMWASSLNIPWFLAGAGVGVPAAVGTVTTGNSKLLSLVSACCVSCACKVCVYVLDGSYVRQRRLHEQETLVTSDVPCACI